MRTGCEQAADVLQEALPQDLGVADQEDRVLARHASGPAQLRQVAPKLVGGGRQLKYPAAACVRRQPRQAALAAAAGSHQQRVPAWLSQDAAKPAHVLNGCLEEH